ncbi:MAG: hypothetical protein ACFWUA_09840 [Sporanaerobacter sp.]|uniref:nucleotide sugar dehydrogenase n=1 Tax=Sporanaerobacter sp. TaxID=2010183 RepID=UPI003A101E73
MNLYEEIKNKKAKIVVVGLGYVGLPLSIAFAKRASVIGFDINKNKIENLQKGIDITNEISKEEIESSGVVFTDEEKLLREAKFFIIAVPTPVVNGQPDLKFVLNATKMVARNITKGSIIVYESTVYPGVTEEICIPLLEIESGLKVRSDFKVSYSPERLNPGDITNRLENIKKIVAGIDDETVEIVSKVYEMVVKAGIYKVDNIKVAEASKLIENVQRDVNIALMNEISIILNKAKIDTNKVLESARTKWNFLNFTPGLVGGHCIGVDSYYLMFKARELGYDPKIIYEARNINEYMEEYVVNNILDILSSKNKKINKVKIVVFGITFKENCSDIRNTQVAKIVKRLEEKGAIVEVVDQVANGEEVLNNFNIKLHSIGSIKEADILIFSVPHKEFLKLNLEDLDKMYKKDEEKILIDIKGMFDKKEALENGYIYWRL